MNSTARQFPVGRGPHFRGDAEPLQHRPAGWGSDNRRKPFPAGNSRAPGRASASRPRHKTPRSSRPPDRFPRWRHPTFSSSFERPLRRYTDLPRAAVEGKARPEQESARGAAQAGRVPDARPVRPRHLRGQSARPAQTGRLLFHALEDGGGRSEDARAARGGLGFRNAHRGERSGVAPARGQADQGIPAALQHLVPRRQALPRRESRSDGGVAAFSPGALQEGRRRALLRAVRACRGAAADAQFHAQKIWRPHFRARLADGARVEIVHLPGADAAERNQRARLIANVSRRRRNF